MKRSGLASTGSLKRGKPLARSAPARKRRPVSPASKLQRGKVLLAGCCAVCGKSQSAYRAIRRG